MCVEIFVSNLNLEVFTNIAFGHDSFVNFLSGMSTILYDCYLFIIGEGECLVYGVSLNLILL